MLKGENASLSRIISLLENESSQTAEIMKLVSPHLGKAHTIGITGPPGVGKSTLADKLTALVRKQGLKVGIVAVDPSSPFTGGAVLGDRIRMQQHYLDDGVFIRSMATRGSMGGLPHVAGSVIKVLDAAGKDIILVETVGVGQNEVDIMERTDTVLVVLCPESGDAIQTMKAGLFEIADIFIVNKADNPGANDVGVEEVYKQVQLHYQALCEGGRLVQRRQMQRRRDFIKTLERRLASKLLGLIEQDGQLVRYIERVEKGELDPYSAADEILESRKLLTGWLRQ